MNDPRTIAASVVGAVDWQTEVSGFCRCPGESLHTHQNGKKDCRVNEFVERFLLDPIFDIVKISLFYEM